MCGDVCVCVCNYYGMLGAQHPTPLGTGVAHRVFATPTGHRSPPPRLDLEVRAHLSCTRWEVRTNKSIYRVKPYSVYAFTGLY